MKVLFLPDVTSTESWAVADSLLDLSVATTWKCEYEVECFVRKLTLNQSVT